MIRLSLLTATIAFVLGALNPASAQIDAAVKAHGGAQKWQSYGSVEYDLAYKNAKGTKVDHQLFNLRSRDGLITADAYTLGSTQGEVWIKPALDALGGTPPRFYIWTPFYFFGMPFVLADPGTVHEALGQKSFQGQNYDVVKITYKSGTGDSPDDYYIAYVDPASGQLKLAVYVVTYSSIRKDKPVDQLKPHAIVFHEWQDVDGLKMPKSAKYYDWKNDTIEGEALGEMVFSNVKFAIAEPDESKFAKPADAVVAPKP